MRQHRQVIMTAALPIVLTDPFVIKLDILSLLLFADISWQISIPSHTSRPSLLIALSYPRKGFWNRKT